MAEVGPSDGSPAPGPSATTRFRSWWRTVGRYGWSEYRWLVIGLTAFTGLVLGTIGWHQYAQMPGLGRQPETWLTSFHSAIGLFSPNENPTDPMPTALAWARFLAPVAVLATVLSGAVALYRSVTQRTKARRERNHLVIVGRGLVSRTVATEAARDARACVVIDVRQAGAADAEPEDLGVPVIPLVVDNDGRADTLRIRRSLRAAQTPVAAELLIATDDDDLNARVARVAEGMVRTTKIGPELRDWRGRRLPDRRGHTEPQIYVESSTLDLVYWLEEALPRIGVDLIEWFNLKERGARDLLDDVAASVPTIAPGVTTATPLLMIVGVTETAIAIAVQYCRNWAGSPLIGVDVVPRLVFVDDQGVAADGGRDLMARLLRDWGPDSTVAERSRCEIVVVDSVDDALRSSPLAAVIAVEDDVRSVGIARLVARIAPDVPVWTCNTDLGGVASFTPDPGHGRLRTCSMPAYALTMARIRTGLSEDLARSMQAADYLARHGATTRGGDDPADRLWSHLDDDTKEKNRAAVDGWRTALDKLGLRVVRRKRGGAEYQFDWIELDFVAEHLHEAWRDVMDARQLWTPPVPGTEGSAERPDRNPWATLPDANRAWSLDQAANLTGHLASFDYVIEEDEWRHQFVEEAARRYYEQCVPLENGSRPSWDSLEESEREANRASARAALVYLWRLGLFATARDAASPVTIGAHEVERMAVLEHARWVGEKERAGWKLGSRSDADRTHPDLLHWGELDEATKNKDRIRIEAIPAVIAGLSLR